MATKFVKYILFSSFLAAFVLFMKLPANAQISYRRAVKQQLQLLKQRLVTAQEILQGYDNQQARELLQKAKDLAEQAALFFQKKQYAQARHTIQIALKLVEKAIRIALDDTIKRLINQLQVLMRRAENSVIGMGHHNAERLIQEAKKNQQIAELARHRGNHMKSVEHYRIAILLVEKALKMTASTNVANLAPSPDVTWQERARFEALAARVLDAIQKSGNQNARAIYKQAMQQAKKAEEAFRSGNRFMASQLFNGTYRLLLRALDLASATPGGSEAYLRSELSTLKELFKSAKERLKDFPGKRKQILFTRAQENLNQATQALQQNRFEAARAYMKLARVFLSRLMRMSGRKKGTSEERMAEELASLERDISRLDRKLSKRKNPRAIEFLHFAQRAARKAEQNYKLGQPLVALQQTLVAQRFLSKAEAIRKEKGFKIDEKQVNLHIGQLRQMIAEFENEMQGNEIEQVRDIIAEVREMLRQAELKKSEGKLFLAYQMADVGIELLQKALRFVRKD